MKNTRFRLGACLLFASLTFQSYSQKSIHITPEITKQILEKNPMQVSVFHITKREVDIKSEKRMASMIDTTAIDVKQLSGDFIILEDKYMLVLADFEGYVKNELINPESMSRYAKVTDRYTVLKRIDANEFYFVMPDNLINQIAHDAEIKRYDNMGNSAEYKTWKSKYLGLIQSAQLNMKACKAIITKHTYLNKRGEKLYDSSTFTKQEKITFNKNLDLLKSKNDQIQQLESNRDLYLYYNDKATTEESAKSYQLSDFYNRTNRIY